MEMRYRDNVWKSMTILPLVNNIKKKKQRTLKRLLRIFICLKLAAISTIQLILCLLPQDCGEIFSTNLSCICNKMLTNSFCFAANNMPTKKHFSSPQLYIHPNGPFLILGLNLVMFTPQGPSRVPETQRLKSPVHSMSFIAADIYLSSA